MKVFIKSYRKILLIFCDMAAASAAYALASAVCGLFSRGNFSPVLFIASLCMVSAFYALIMGLLGIYHSIWRYAQSIEYLLCLFASAAAGSLYCFFDIVFVREEPLPLYFYSLFVLGSVSAHISERLIYRTLLQFCHKSSPDRKRAVIVGAGAAATMFITEALQYSSCSYLPVAIVDDDLQKQGRKISNVRVCGTVSDIKPCCEKYRAELIIIAIPSASSETRALIIEKCMETELPVRTLPHISDINGDASLVEGIREITPEELLGREPVAVADENILSFISGRTVAVTGGGGSIGSELCRQIASHSPRRLIVIDIYENNAYDLQQELKRKYGSELDLEVYICSVREARRIEEILNIEKPDILLHAAAHKHVPLMEACPQEAVKNNIFGTLNTAAAAARAGVKKFIMISTDKAVNPTNIMGATKRVCEMIVQSRNGLSSTVFAAVRFGNVLGSNGSVIPLFIEQIKNDGPVTVTHPEINRFFMTIPEAAQLVLTAGAMAKGGEIFILDMGKPVKIDDLAKKMIQLSGKKDIKIIYTGLRPGEKLYEELLLSEEGTQKTENKKIFIGNQNGVDRAKLEEQLEGLRDLLEENPADIKMQIELRLAEITGTFRRPDYSDKALNAKIS